MKWISMKIVFLSNNEFLPYFTDALCLPKGYVTFFAHRNSKVYSSFEQFCTGTCIHLKLNTLLP